MLPKQARLTAEEVREVLTKGRSARASSVSAKFVPAPTGKAAIVVSTKVAKTAVVRNTLRRRGYKALPTPLPRASVVFFIQRKDFDPADIALLCSKLS
ncbi:MAG: ribonuclease P protein component [Patescibacteria group bacterium]